MRPAISTYAFLLASFALVAGAPTEDVDVDNEGAYTLQYSGNWTVSRTDTSSHGGSSSYTTTPGDAFELRFNGTSVEFYGTSSPASAKFAVHLDGTSHGTCNTTVTENLANNVLLWSLDNLSNDTEHVFHVAHNDTDGKILSLDWLSYKGTPPTESGTSVPVGASNPPTTPSPSPSTTVDASKSKPNRTATIVGGFFGAVLGIAILLVLLFLWLRRGRHQARTTQISGIDHGSRRMSSGDYLTDSYAGRYGYGGAGMYSTKDSNGGVGGTATWGTRHDEYGGVDKAYMTAGGGKWEGRTDMRPKTSIMLSSLKRKVSVLNPAVALAHLSNRSTDRGTSRDMNGVSSGNGVGSGGAVVRSNSFGNIKTSLSGLFSKTGRHSGQPSPDSYESRGGSVNRHGEDVKAPVPVPHLYNSYKSRPSTDAGVGARPLLTTGPAVPFQIPVLDNGGALDPTTITRPDPALLASTATTQPLSSKFPATESIRIPLTTKPNLRDLPSPPVVPPANQTSFPADSGAPTGTDSNRVSAASPTMDFTSPTTGNVVYSHPFSTAGVYQPIKSSSASMRSRQGSDAIVDISDIGSATHGNSYGQGGASGAGYHPYAPYAADYGKRSGTGYGPFGGSTSSLQLPDSASVDNQTYSSHAPLREGSEKGKGKAVYEPGRNVVELSGKGASGQETSSVRSGGTRELPPIPPNAAQTSGHVRSNSDASLVAKPATTTTTGAAARNEWGTFHKFPSTSSLTQPQTQPQLQSTTVSRNPEHFTHSRSNSFSSYDRINLGMHNRNNSTPSISYYPNATSADGLARSYDQTVFTRPESRASSVSSKRFSNQLFSR